MPLDRPPPEPLPLRPLMVSPFRDAVSALCFEPLDISGLCDDVLARTGANVGPGRLAAALAASTERPDVVLRRMARNLDH